MAALVDSTTVGHLILTLQHLASAVDSLKHEVHIHDSLLTTARSMSKEHWYDKAFFQTLVGGALTLIGGLIAHSFRKGQEGRELRNVLSELIAGQLLIIVRIRDRLRKKHGIDTADIVSLREAVQWHGQHLREILAVPKSQQRGEIAIWFRELLKLADLASQRESYPPSLDEALRTDYDTLVKDILALCNTLLEKAAWILEWFGLFVGTDGFVFRDKDIPRDSLWRK